MKINKIYGLFIGLMVLMVSSCDPIVDEEYLENTTDIAGVELVATQSTPGGNKITLEMATPGITGYWDYNLGKALTDKFEFIYPIPGKATFTYVGTLGAEFFEKTIDVQIDQLDNALDQDWYDLVGEDTAAGKTWVFNGTGGDERLWWYMSPPDNWAGVWWNAGGTCCPPFDQAGKMKFDLDGAANFTYQSGPDADQVKSSFVLDVGNQMLQINGGNILGAVECGTNASAKYQIISLTEDELILFIPNGTCGSGWTWIFKPE
ncbi:hypothetical protein [Namhaeicola litoreus]|uniref:Uncharacterized protein n=1 Tax=Namhaeicola litoreus TaxID=1052145 RepID=A0ABW3XWS7_9FLAO